MNYPVVYINIFIWLLITCTSLSKSSFVCYDCASCNGLEDVSFPSNFVIKSGMSYNVC